jgi:hypothetical protein
VTLPDVSDLRHPDGLYADPAQVTKLARFFQNANSGVAASLVVKATSGLLAGFTVSSVSAQFIQVFDLAALPANAAVPVLSFEISALSSRSFAAMPFPRGFKNGIVIANSSTQHALTIGSANCIFDAQYL